MRLLQILANSLTSYAILYFFVVHVNHIIRFSAFSTSGAAGQPQPTDSIINQHDAKINHTDFQCKECATDQDHSKDNRNSRRNRTNPPAFILPFFTRILI